MTVEGSVDLQISTQNVGAFDAFYNSVKVRKSTIGMSYYCMVSESMPKTKLCRLLNRNGRCRVLREGAEAKTITIISDSLCKVCTFDKLLRRFLLSAGSSISPDYATYMYKSEGAKGAKEMIFLDEQKDLERRPW